MTVKIKLTRGKTATVDGGMEFLKNWKWCCTQYGYAVRGFYKSSGKRGILFLHHAVIGRPLNGLQVDHIDGDRLNNTRGNLRIVSSRENGQNRKVKSASGLVGVYRNWGKWLAQIYISGEKRHLGRFATKKDASRAYWQAVEALVPRGK
jgi:hypothetical protein